MQDNTNTENGPIPTIDEPPTVPPKACALCGCSAPAVKCDRCNCQIFCLSCDDMYHRHPKRRLHLRKAVDSIWNSGRSPRLRRRTELPGDPSKIPIPPPRTKKKEHHGIGRLFMNSKFELGSFGHSKVFDPRTLPLPPKHIFAGRKSPAQEGNYENENAAHSPISKASEPSEIYENEGVLANRKGSLDQSPWNPMRTNIASPIQVQIPPSSTDFIANGQAFGFSAKQHSRSITDLSSQQPIGAHPFNFPYPYMHPPFAHPNCVQCVSSSWSNLMSSQPNPYFHPMWGAMSHGHSNGSAKNGHTDLPTYPDSNMPMQFPGGPFYPNNFSPLDPSLIKNSQQVKRSRSGSRHSAENASSPYQDEARSQSAKSPSSSSADKQEIDVSPVPPTKPKQPWTCVHCTFINPPGIYICQVCCKTSYGNQSPSNELKNDEEMDVRNSESPMELVNMDAVEQSFGRMKPMQKVN